MRFNSDFFLIAAGLHSLAFCLFHLGFRWIFRWREQLAGISSVNRAIMHVLNLCLTFLLFTFAVIVLLDRAEIMSTRLGHHLLLAMSVFWALRLIEQFVFFRLTRPPSILLSALFAAGVLLYAWPLATAPAPVAPASSTMSTKHHESHIDYLEFPAPSAAALAATKQFNAAVYGWKYQDWGDSYADTSTSGLMSGLNADRAQPIPATLAVIYTTQLEKMRDRVTAAGGKITRDIFAFPGGRRFHYADPAGNQLGVWSDK